MKTPEEFGKEWRLRLGLRPWSQLHESFERWSGDAGDDPGGFVTDFPGWNRRGPSPFAWVGPQQVCLSCDLELTPNGDEYVHESRCSKTRHWFVVVVQLDSVDPWEADEPIRRMLSELLADRGRWHLEVRGEREKEPERWLIPHRSVRQGPRESAVFEWGRYPVYMIPDWPDEEVRRVLFPVISAIIALHHVTREMLDAWINPPSRGPSARLTQQSA